VGAEAVGLRAVGLGAGRGAALLHEPWLLGFRRRNPAIVPWGAEAAEEAAEALGAEPRLGWPSFCHRMREGPSIDDPIGSLGGFVDLTRKQGTALFGRDVWSYSEALVVTRSGVDEVAPGGAVGAHPCGPGGRSPPGYPAAGVVVRAGRS
jgi:hypothetical protein